MFDPTALIKRLNYVTLGINKLSLGIYLNDNLIGKKAKQLRTECRLFLL